MLNDSKPIDIDDFTYDFYKEVVRRLRCLYADYGVEICDIESVKSYRQTKKRIRFLCIYLWIFRSYATKR